MPRNITVTFSDGTTHVYNNAPDDVTPEEVTARAEQEFGKDVTALDGGRKAQPIGRSSSGRGGFDNNVPVIDDARKVIEALFPGVRITQQKRDPDSELGRKNPRSWHNHTAAAVDIDPNTLPKGVSYDQFIDTIRKAGFPIVHAQNEVTNPSSHATGPHFHVVLGPQMEGYPPLFEGGGAAPEPEDAEEVGLEGTVTDDGPPSDPAQAPQQPGSRFFGIPTVDQLLKGLEYGAGSMVEGVGDTLGIVTNPVSTMVGRGLGYDNYTADLGGELRDGLGLDRPKQEDTANRISGNIVSGVTGGAMFGGAAGATSNLVKSQLAKKALAELGRTPVRDAVAGGTASVASDATEQMGGGPVAQTAAALAGGMAGYGGASAAKALTPDGRSTRFANKQAKNNPDAAYDAEIVEDLAKTRDEQFNPTDKKGRADMTVSVVNSVERSYLTKFNDLISRLDLPDAEKLELKAAIMDRASISRERLADISDMGEAGQAVARSIYKTQRLRKLTPELPRADGPLRKAAKVGAAALDLAPAVGLPGTYGAASIGLRTLFKKAGTIGGEAQKARVHATDALLAKQRGYEKLGKIVGPSGQRESQKALWDTVESTLAAKEAVKNTKAAAKEAKQAAATEAALKRQQAKAAAEKLKADNARVGINNDLDNIIPADGYRRYIYDQTGLKQKEQDIGALNAVWKKKLTPEQFDAHLKSPDALIPGKAGLALTDRLASMADDGLLKRDPTWKPPEAAPPAQPTGAAPMVDAQGAPIRSMPAYQGGIQKNIAREMPILQEIDTIMAERSRLYDSDPEYAKVAGTPADPFVSRLKDLQNALSEMRKPKTQ
jgi:hypothetical protein